MTVMAEIEVKAKLKNREEVKRSLEKLGCVFFPPITQKDRAYYGASDTKGPGVTVLRIREQNDGKVLFTLKQSRSNELDCLEKEIFVSNANELDEMIRLLGFHEVIKINKTRQKGKLNDLEICLDEVEGLGNFIEVEKICDDDADAVQKELYELLESVGVMKEDHVLRGYDTLLIEKTSAK